MQNYADSNNKKYNHLDSKYDLGVFHVSQRVQKLQKAKLLDGNKKFFRQNKGNFGYIPLTPLLAKIRDNPTRGDINILEAHKRVKQDGRHNFEGLQIPVQSKLNHEKFFQYLTNYWDWQLPFLIKYGFPLDIDVNKNILTDQVNHKSAIMFKDHIEHYLKTEIDHEAILGPFQEPPFELHTSPFLTKCDLWWVK